MKNWLLKLLLNLILISLSISIPLSAEAAERGGKTEVKASILAKTEIRIFGYTAPNAIVQAEGIRTFAQVSADRTGYFLMESFSVSPEAKEVCLNSIDSERRMGFPTCVALIDTDKSYEIGPVLLSPTLSLSKGSLWEKESASAFGSTLPETEVVFSFFELNPSPSTIASLKNNLVKIFNFSVFAAELPQLSTLSDKKGNFSITLPTARIRNFRVFAKAFYRQMPTPKVKLFLLRSEPLLITGLGLSCQKFC